MYGTILAGPKQIAFVTDAKGKTIVDVNGDGDLSNDAPVVLKTQESNPESVTFGSVTIDIGKDVPVAINIIHFDAVNPPSPQWKDKMIYYFDYGYDVTFSLDGKPYSAFVSGEPTEKTRIPIDRNGDGKISTFKENATVGVPFNFTGTTYKFSLTPLGLDLAPAAEKIAMAPMPPNFALGQKTIPIVAEATDGSKVDLLKDYKGKLVMLDFWATWCGPCIGELPNVKAAYAKYHDQGFEVLGISFDQANMADKLKAFTTKNEMPWKQIYEGKYWDTKIGGDYDVAGIPFTLLIDGDTGEILGDSRNLRGPGITEFIGTKLAEKKAAK